MPPNHTRTGVVCTTQAAERSPAHRGSSCYTRLPQARRWRYDRGRSRTPRRTPRHGATRSGRDSAGRTAWSRQLLPTKDERRCATVFASGSKVYACVMHAEDWREGQRRVAHVLPGLGSLTPGVASGAAAYPFTDPSPLTPIPRQDPRLKGTNR